VNLQEFRALQRDLVTIELDLGEITDELKSHPDRPGPGSSPTRAWNDASRKLNQERKELKEERRKLLDKVAAAKAELLQTPLSLVTLAELIDALVVIEATFEERTADDAHAKVTALVDWLEGEEARLHALEDQGRKAS
jgi:hypothetical protein